MSNAGYAIMKFKRIYLALSLLLGSSVWGQVLAQTNNAFKAMDVPLAAPPNAQGAQAEQKMSLTEGDWSFDLISSGNTRTARITYYAGKQNAIVIVPAVLGGAAVTSIASQAFGHHSEILAVYVPRSVTQIADWAFYDLNAAQIISIANPALELASGALQSTANAVVYLPKTALTERFKTFKITQQQTQDLSINLNNSQAAAIAPGDYLNVLSKQELKLTLAQVLAIARSASAKATDVVQQEQQLTFKGATYQAQTPKIEIAKSLQKHVDIANLNHRFSIYTAASAADFNQKLKQNSAYADLFEFLQVDAGAYLDGSPVQLDKTIQAFDVQTGESIISQGDSSALTSTGQGKYKYVAWQDEDQNGKIDHLYYSPYALNYQFNDVLIKSDLTALNGLKARDRLNPLYLAFANAVLKASGQQQHIQRNKLVLHSAQQGQPIEAKANKNRSIVWADDYAQIKVAYLNAQSNAIGDWALMSLVMGLAVPNTEIVMEWGMNALLYATNGGQIEVGSLTGATSEFYANGDGANGIIAGAAGQKDSQSMQLPSTSSVIVKNAHFKLEGWNNHVADTLYGGYAKLQKVTAITGKPGSYAVGQSSALANDFGNGVVEAEHFHTTVYGNRSAGAYVIGGGIIRAKDSSFVSKMDAGLVTASGGHYHVEHSTVEGQIAIRNRGGIVADSSSDFYQVQLNSKRDLSNYVSGESAAKAVAAWQTATGNRVLASPLMSRDGYTFAQLAAHYQLASEQRQQLLQSLSKIAQVAYTEQSLVRNSPLDNTFYNYSAGNYVGNSDYSEVPFLTVGSSFGGLTAAILEFENAGTQLNLDQVKVSYAQASPYQYLLASEAGSAAQVAIKNSQLKGLIWNEGDVNRVVEGQPGQRSSSVDIQFEQSQFTGSFADGSNGLWSVDGHNYRNAAGKTTNLNGNYYGALANWKGRASFDKQSIWYITHDSYLGALKLSDDSQIIAPKGYQVQLRVDGKLQQLHAGEYTGHIEIVLLKQ